MRILSNIVGALLLVVGCVWFLQGISILPGSFMTGSLMWAVIGVFCIVAGIAFLFLANRRKA
jgi:hypothetical protein